MPRKVWYLRWLGALCAVGGLGGLVFHALGIVHIGFFLSFVGAPSVIALCFMAVWAKSMLAAEFRRALLVGLAGGLLATLAYDLVRGLLQSTGRFEFNPFRAIYIFGGWISHTAEESVAAAIVGWVYHFWNGASFAVFYCLVFGRKHWIIGAVYGVGMEILMLGIYPLFLAIKSRIGFVIISLAGHLSYGIVLGLLSQAYGPEWKNDERTVRRAME